MALKKELQAKGKALISSADPYHSLFSPLTFGIWPLGVSIAYLYNAGNNDNGTW